MHRPRTAVVFGRGSVGGLSAVLDDVSATRSCSTRRVLFVSDPGITATAMFGDAVDAVRRGGRDVETFAEFSPNPDTEDVATGGRFAGGYRPDVIVGFGGGSSLDCAKGINFVYSCGGTIAEYRGSATATTPLLPMVAIPTTAGTGSEMQSYAVISDAETGMKLACGDPSAAPAVAILDPELTRTAPPLVAALAGLDAISHVVEAYVSRAANPINRMYAAAAAEKLFGGYRASLGKDVAVDVREAMQWGAAWAGSAIESGMLGAAHALANPLTAAHGLPHGLAVALTLPVVMRLNASEAGDRYGALAAAVNGGRRGPTLDEHVRRCVAAAVPWLSGQPGGAWLPTDGSTTGASSPDGFAGDPAGEPLGGPPDIAILTSGALAQWTGRFNPVALNEANVGWCYREIIGGGGHGG